MLFSKPAVSVRRSVPAWPCALLAGLSLALCSGPLWAQPVEKTPAAQTPASPAAGAPVATTPGAAPAPQQAQPSCPTFNLAARAKMSAEGVKGDRRGVVHDGRLATEGTQWSAEGWALILKNEQSHITLDLGTSYPIRALVVQADNNDTYRMEGSEDGVNYQELWRVGTTEGQGLKTRYATLGQPKTARYLRIRPVSGDTYYSVSETRAYCEVPTAWPPALRYPPPKRGWDAIDNPVMVGIKGWMAVAGALLLLWGVVVRWAGRPNTFRRTRDVLLATLGLAAFLSWWNLGHFHFDHYIHIWEHYHYYMGAKYGPELRYSRLYNCTAAADLADGLHEKVKERKMRDLETNELGSSQKIMSDPTRCTKHFTPERWEQFRRDNRFFRSRFSNQRWNQSQQDHGYNATPVWAIAARIFTNIYDLSWENITKMGLIDSAILVIMWAVVWWAFGWRPMCVALLYWGCNFPARYYWNGGAFLRYDWQVWMIIGVCLLKKNKMGSGGFALTYATLLRIFPGMVVAAVVLKAVYRMVQERRFVLSREHMSFATGCILALAILVPVSSWPTNGLDAWLEFAQNSSKHLATPLTNNMGLKTVLGYDFGTRAIKMRNDKLDDPFGDWKDARHHFYTARRPLLFALIMLFAFALARAGSRGKDWEAAALGTGLIPIATELTCYYYGFLLTYGLLWERRKLPGIAACILAAVTCLFPELWTWNDDHFAAMSLATALTVAIVTVHVGWEGAGPQFEAIKSSLQKLASRLTPKRAD